MLPIAALSIPVRFNGNVKQVFKPLAGYIIAVMLVYGSWPLRNFVSYGKIEFSQRIGGINHWDDDYIAFMNYIWGIQTGEEPVHTQILRGDSIIDFPKAAYKIKEDSVKLMHVISLCRTCGTGFSHFQKSAHFRKDIVEQDKNCDEEIKTIFNELLESQKRNNAFNYYVTVPLQNLNKAVFKLYLAKPSGQQVYYLGITCFLFRIILLVLGMIGHILLFRNKEFWPAAIVIGGYFLTWYIFRCWFFRSMEIRYFLMADVLMLIPAAYELCIIIPSVKKTL
jgi:hypothetical protein